MACTILLLQGGGALGAYQCGAAEALAEAGEAPDWVAGISIGAINAAILAGNAPDRRMTALRTFWERITARQLWAENVSGWLAPRWLNLCSAATIVQTGAPGFFVPRWPSAAMRLPGTPGARSFYDTGPLRETLLELVDFDLLNDGPMRISVGAVNVESGNMTWFDSADMRLTVDHIMASGALPPGFPAVEIDGAHYWDGGMVSNTPLQYVLDVQDGSDDLTIWQVDLWSARGQLPDSVWASESREKDIRFSSRTRMVTDMMRERHAMHQAARRLARRLPEAMRDDPDLRNLMNGERDPHIAIAHLIYRQLPTENGTKDFEFSRRSMEGHWQAGARDTQRTLGHADWQRRGQGQEMIEVFDLSEPDSHSGHGAASQGLAVPEGSSHVATQPLH